MDGLVVDDIPVLFLGECFLPSLEGVRPVYEVEVEILQAEVGEGLPAGGLHIVRVMLVVPELAGDENLVSGHSRGLYTCGHFLRVEDIIMTVLMCPVSLSTFSLP